MADKFLKIGGRSDTGIAKAIKTDENGVTKTTQDETTSLRTTRTNVVGYERKVVEQSLPGRRNVTVSHVGDGGSVYVGDGTKNGVKLNSASNPIKISADETLDVKVIAEPFELQSDRFSPSIVQYIKDKELLVALEGRFSYWSFDFGKTWARQGGISEDHGDTFTSVTLGESLSNGEHEMYAGSYYWRAESDLSAPCAYAFKSVDTGRTWKPLEIVYPGMGGHNTDEVIDILYKNKEIYLTLNGIASVRGVWKSTDYGKTWEKPHSLSGSPEYFCDTGDSILLTKANNNDGDIIFRKMDNEDNFELVGVGEVPRVQHMDSKPLYVGDNTCFIATRFGAHGRSRKILKSTNINDVSPNWKEVYDEGTNAENSDSHFIWSASAYIKSKNIIMFGQGYYDGFKQGHRIVYSSDGGENFQDLLRIGEIKNITHAGGNKTIVSVSNAENPHSDGIYLSPDAGLVTVNMIEER